MTTYKPDHDLGWDNSFGRCLSCGAPLTGQEYVLYSKGDPGAEEVRTECPRCGARHRRFQVNEYDARFDWVNRNRSWAVGDYVGEPDGFTAAVIAYSIDGSVPCYLEEDGTITYGNFGDSERFLPESVKAEVDRRLGILGEMASRSVKPPRWRQGSKPVSRKTSNSGRSRGSRGRSVRSTATRGSVQRGTPSTPRKGTHDRQSERVANRTRDRGTHFPKW